MKCVNILLVFEAETIIMNLIIIQILNLCNHSLKNCLNICIFVDGDYWHANPNPHIESGQKRSGFKFDDKIRGGVYAEDKWARDERITKTLEERGYIVLRFYVSKIQKNPKKCLEKIIKVIKESSR